MGVLDDAIRQHIDLKRQHGASEDELERKEQEALGPARRDVSPAPEDSGADPAAGGDSPTDGDIPAPGPAEGPFDDGDIPAPEPAEGPFDERETRVVAPFAGERAPAHDAADDWLEPDDFDPGRSTAQDPVADELDPAHSRASAAPADGDEPEDVLEETPEFLQETPEHDRLWFEQKPPRDFDFDDK